MWNPEPRLWWLGSLETERIKYYSKIRNESVCCNYNKKEVMRQWPIQKGWIQMGIKNLILEIHPVLEKTCMFEGVQTWTTSSFIPSFRDLKKSHFFKTEMKDELYFNKVVWLLQHTLLLSTSHTDVDSISSFAQNNSNTLLQFLVACCGESSKRMGKGKGRCSLSFPCIGQKKLSRIILLQEQSWSSLPRYFTLTRQPFKGKQ